MENNGTSWGYVILKFSKKFHDKGGLRDATIQEQQECLSNKKVTISLKCKVNDPYLWSLITFCPVLIWDSHKSCHSTEMFQNILQKVLPSMFGLGGHCFRMVRNTIVLILAILSMQTLASPLNLKVSIKGVQNGDTAEKSIPACVEKGHFCGRFGLICCEGLKCKHGPGFTRTCQ